MKNKLKNLKKRLGVMSSCLLLMVLLISCNTSKKVATSKVEVDKSTIEQEASKQEENASSSVVVVDSSQVDEETISEFEITRTTINESIKGKVKSNSKEKKAISEAKKDNITKTNQEDRLKAKIDTKKTEETKISKKSNSTRIWWYLGFGAIIAVLLWFNKGKIIKWLVKIIRG